MLPKYMKTARFVIPVPDVSMAQYDLWDSKLDEMPGMIDFETSGNDYDIEIAVCEEDNLDEIQAKLLSILSTKGAIPHY